MDLLSVILVILAVSGVFSLVNIYNELIQLENTYLDAFSQLSDPLRERQQQLGLMLDYLHEQLGSQQPLLDICARAQRNANKALWRARKTQRPCDIEALEAAELYLYQQVSALSDYLFEHPLLVKDEHVQELYNGLCQCEQDLAEALLDFNRHAALYNQYRDGWPGKLFARRMGHPRDALSLALPEALPHMPNPPTEY